jgi:hypothetical protein
MNEVKNKQMNWRLTVDPTKNQKKKVVLCKDKSDSQAISQTNQKNAGDVAQMIEHLLLKHKALSSNPVTSATWEV